MNAKEKLDLAIRGAMIAHSALHLTEVASKGSAKMIVYDLFRLVRELDGKVDGIKEEGK